MAENLEDFLRRAAERKQQRKQQQPNAKPTSAQPGVPVNSYSPPPPPKPVNRQSDQRSVGGQQKAANAKPQKQPKKFESSFQLRPYLAPQVENRDDQMQEHLHQMFDHNVGQLTGNRKTPQTPVTRSPKPNEIADTELVNVVTENSLAQQVLQAFRNPQSAKLAFVMSEIFQRKF